MSEEVGEMRREGREEEDWGGREDEEREGREEEEPEGKQDMYSL